MAADHQGVFLVGIIADGRRVILVVDRTLGLEAVEPPRTGVARQHNLTGLDWILDRVPNEDRRPSHGVQARPDQRGVATEPPNLQRVAPWDGVDGDDGGPVGCFESGRERILVGARMVGATGSDKTGEVIGTTAVPGFPQGWQHPLADIHGPGIDARRFQDSRQREASRRGIPRSQIGDHGA